MTDFTQSEIALYDLGERPATFDILTFLAGAKTCGAKHVRFVYGAWKPKNYTIRQAEERFLSIVAPSVTLYGMTYSIGERAGVSYTHFIKSLILHYNKAKRIAKIEYPIEPKGYITITLRRSRSPQRNSNTTEWRKFASTVAREVVLIQDYEDQPIELMERMKLYARAEMNLMVNNGPALLCVLSDAPYLMMRTLCGPDCGAASEAIMAKLGITKGFQYPWANERQRLSYLEDTAENIHREFNLMCQRERMVA